MYTKEQQASHRQLWLAALRSGEYQQQTGSLGTIRSEPKYCCLGVACEVAIQNGAPVERKISDRNIISYNGENGTLPDAVRDWLGLTDHCGSFNTETDGVDCISAANDDRDWDFARIADFIEAGGLRIQ